MKRIKQNVTNYYRSHIYCSLILFLASFFFPAFYIYDWFKPVYPSSFFLFGWLGPTYGFYSWYANILYLIGIILNRQKIISVLIGSVGIVLALSFLRHDNFEYGQYYIGSTINAYGLGFYFWLLSIGIFTAGQLVQAANVNFRAYIIFQLSLSLIFVAIILSSYLNSKKSRSAYEKERSLVFEEKCKIAEEQIYKKVDGATGIFYDPDSYQEIINISNGKGYLGTGGSTASGALNSGLIKFYEIRNRSSELKTMPYLRVTSTSNPNSQETDHLESEYALLQIKFQLPERLHISGAEVFVKYLRNDTILAKSIYVYDAINNKFCGHSRNGSYSSDRILQETLQLSKKYQ
jgi:cbb3-type cytochrome oxidase subunit 3